MQFTFLPKTSLWNALSPLGKSIETPKGIFYWSGRAKSEAQIDGTIGIAQDDDGTISHLKVAEEWAGQKVMQRVPKAKVFAYGPIEGVESLRKKWLEMILAKHPTLKPFAAMPVVTNGITHSLALAGRLFLEAGQTLITADKSWENYEHIYSGVQGIKITTFPLFIGDGIFNIDGLIGICRETAALHKKVTLLLNFPHNQTGFMPHANDCKELGQRLQNLCKEMPEVPFVVLLDDAYEGYVYDAAGQKQSLLSDIFAPLPNLTVVKLDGISKVLLAYGYRIAFFTVFCSPLDGKEFSTEDLKGISGEVGTKVGGFVRGEISQVNHHGQILADALLDEWPTVSSQRSEVITRLGQRWQAMMKSIEEGYAKYGKEKLWLDPCNGGFFGYFNLAKGIEPKNIAERLLSDKKVGVVPSDQGLRVAFAGVSKEKVPEMVRAIFEVVYG